MNHQVVSQSHDFSFKLGATGGYSIFRSRTLDTASYIIALMKVLGDANCYSQLRRSILFLFFGLAALTNTSGFMVWLYLAILARENRGDL